MHLLDHHPTTAGTIDDFTPSAIAAENTGIAIQLLGSIYSRSRDAVLRELTANALDAQHEIGIQTPVQIHLPHLDKPQLIVTDHGVGMTEDQLISHFANAAASTKRNDTASIGRYGIGTLTPTAVADQYHVCSIRDGVRTLMLLRVNASGLEHKVIASQPTDEPSGTMVTVALDAQEESQWLEAAARVFADWRENLIEITSPTQLPDDAQLQTQDFTEFSDKTVTFMMARAHRSMLRVRINELIYNVPDSASRAIQSQINSIANRLITRQPHSCFIIEADPQMGLPISKTRETIDDTDSTRQIIADIISTWAVKQRDRLIDEIITPEATLYDIYKSRHPVGHFSLHDRITRIIQGDIVDILKSKGIEPDFRYTSDKHVAPQLIQQPDFTIYGTRRGRAYAESPTTHNYTGEIAVDFLNRMSESYLIRQSDITDELAHQLEKWNPLDEEIRTMISLPQDIGSLDHLLPQDKQHWVSTSQMLDIIDDSLHNPAPPPEYIRISSGRDLYASQYNAIFNNLLSQLSPESILIKNVDCVPEDIKFRLDPEKDFLISAADAEKINVQRNLPVQIITISEYYKKYSNEILQKFTQQQRDALATVTHMKIDPIHMKHIQTVIKRKNLHPEAKRLLETIVTGLDPKLTLWRNAIREGYTENPESPALKPLFHDDLDVDYPLIAEFFRIAKANTRIDVTLINTLMEADLAAHAKPSKKTRRAKRST